MTEWSAGMAVEEDEEVAAAAHRRRGVPRRLKQLGSSARTCRRMQRKEGRSYWEA